jgi:ElaB/YqjD/DUF883 family membrane-anchored ribosome-binding protein
MKKKLASITERRHRLVTQAAEQREALAKSIQPLHKGFSLADKSLKIAGYVKEHPILIMGIAAFIGMLKPTRAVKWLRRSWIASLAIRGLRTWLSKS